MKESGARTYNEFNPYNGGHIYSNSRQTPDSGLGSEEMQRAGNGPPGVNVDGKGSTAPPGFAAAPFPGGPGGFYQQQEMQQQNTYRSDNRTFNRPGPLPSIMNVPTSAPEDMNGGNNNQSMGMSYGGGPHGGQGGQPSTNYGGAQHAQYYQAQQQIPNNQMQYGCGTQPLARTHSNFSESSTGASMPSQAPTSFQQGNMDGMSGSSNAPSASAPMQVPQMYYQHQMYQQGGPPIGGQAYYSGGNQMMGAPAAHPMQTPQGPMPMQGMQMPMYVQHPHHGMMFVQGNGAVAGQPMAPSHYYPMMGRQDGYVPIGYAMQGMQGQTPMMMRPGTIPNRAVSASPAAASDSDPSSTATAVSATAMAPPPMGMPWQTNEQMAAAQYPGMVPPMQQVVFYNPNAMAPMMTPGGHRPFALPVPGAFQQMAPPQMVHGGVPMQGAFPSQTAPAMRGGYGGGGSFRGRGGYGRGGYRDGNSFQRNNGGSQRWRNPSMASNDRPGTAGSIDRDRPPTAKSELDDTLNCDAELSLEVERTLSIGTPVEPHRRDSISNKQLLQLAGTSSLVSLSSMATAEGKGSSSPAESSPAADGGEQRPSIPANNGSATPRRDERKEMLESRRTPKLDQGGSVSSDAPSNDQKAPAEPAKKQLTCQYCKSKGFTEEQYSSHEVRERDSGVCLCPILREQGCEKCGEKGDAAHTKFFCKAGKEAVNSSTTGTARPPSTGPKRGGGSDLRGGMGHGYKSNAGTYNRNDRPGPRRN